MTRLRTVLFAMVVAVVVGIAPAAPASVGAGIHHAGLVVRYADGSTTYAWVAFTEDEISGIDLLRRSGLSLVTTAFGPLGEAVCRIGDSGCEVAECGSTLCQSSADAPYWQYFRRTADGWRPMITGASAARVRDGDIDAWEWTAGDASLPALDANGIRDLVGVAGADAGDEAVSRTYSANGNALAGPTAAGAAGTSVVAGIVVLAVLAGSAAMVARRQRRPRAGR